MDEKELLERITQYTSERIDMLKRRADRCRCKYCGSKLTLKRIVFVDYDEARVEIFCTHCNRIEYGVEPEIYESAKAFVEHSGFNAFPDLGESENTTQMTIAKVCEMMAWENQSLGIHDDEGFLVELHKNESFQGECVTYSEEDLDADV